MGNAFTPGLLVTPNTTVRKSRKLPIGGRPKVAVGQTVSANSVVAVAERPGNLVVVRAADILEINPSQIFDALHCAEGDIVCTGQILGEVSILFGLIRNECSSPIDGFVEAISDVTGHISIREPAHLVEVNAYIAGEVIEVNASEVIIATAAGIIQGIFGIGGEVSAQIQVFDIDSDILSEHISDDLRGKLIVGKYSIAQDAIIKAQECGVAGIVLGSITHKVIDFILGEPIGVAITGQEEVGFTLLVTEGFGSLKMAERTYQLLNSFNGKIASFNGTTQIRAGVVRPEVIIPLSDVIVNTDEVAELAVAQELQIGTSIRIIRAPYFGAIAKVTALPEQPVIIETETLIRVLEAQCEDGRKAIVPRANVEIIS